MKIQIYDTTLRDGTQSEGFNLSANAIQVDDPQIGHNPYKFANRLQQAALQRHQSTTHIISRRGDIACLTPWNRAPAVNKSRQLARQQPEMRSISIELEAWYTSYKQPFSEVPEADFRILGLMPYTPAQLRAVAFILKKLSAWGGNVNLMATLGFTRTELEGKLGMVDGHVPGMLPASAYLDASAGPGGEFQLPLGWSLGDPLPAHLQSHARLWDRRHDLYYRHNGVSEGYQIGHFDDIKNHYDNIPGVESSEIFRERDDDIFAAARTGDGIGSPAQAATLAAGEAYARAQSMQSEQRAGIYNAAPIAADAVITAAAEAHARRVAAAFSTASIPVVQNAIAFDFATGRWVLATVNVTVPAAAEPTAATPPPASPPQPQGPSQFGTTRNPNSSFGGRLRFVRGFG